MLDLAVAMPPSPPPPALIRQWKDDARGPEAAIRLTRRVVESYRAEVSKWIESTKRLKRAYALLGPTDFTPGSAGQLADMIADAEKLAEEKAIQLQRTAKRHRIEQKRIAVERPSLAATARSLSEMQLEADREAIEGLLELSLFMRSVHAELSGDRGEVQTFSDPAALERALLSQ